MKCGYKDPELDKFEFPDVIKNLEKIAGASGADLYQAPTGRCRIPIRSTEILT
jgi:hypothetical protein